MKEGVSLLRGRITCVNGCRCRYLCMCIHAYVRACMYLPDKGVEGKEYRILEDRVHIHTYVYTHMYVCIRIRAEQHMHTKEGIRLSGSFTYLCANAYFPL